MKVGGKRSAGEEERCDTRIWSGACEHKTYVEEGDKYRCDACGTIAVLDHQVNHVSFPHVSGDYDNLY